MANTHGGSRVGAVCAVGGLAFLVLILVANPVGDALSKRGVSPLLIGVGMTVLVLLCLGIPIVMLIRHRRAIRRTRTRQQRRLLRNWAAASQWQSTDEQQNVPEVLRRARLGDSAVLQSFASPQGGCRLTLWGMKFSHWGSPVVAGVDFLCLVTDGLRDDVWMGMGTTTGIARYALSQSSSPRLWAKLPPSGLPLEIAQHPWGMTRTAIWPGPGTPAADALVEVAATLEALGGWLLVQNGQVQVAVGIDEKPVDPQRLVDLNAMVVRMMD